MNKNNEITDWFNEVEAIPDPWQEAKPKLTQKEIKNSVRVFKSFVDPYNQDHFYWIIKNKFHKDTFNRFWKLAHRYNRNPVAHPYSIDQYIKDKNIGMCNNEDCGKCGCD